MPRYPQSDSIRQLFNRGQPIVAGKGEVILGNESTPNGVYYIQSGYVKIYTISNDGDEYLHIIYGQGEIFPVIWAFLGVQSKSLFYETLSECTLWRLSRDWLHTFMINRPDICYALSQQLAQQFRIFADRVDNLEYKRASERVAYRLLFLANRFGNKQPDGSISIDPPITHAAFASSINLARESVSRELEKLEKEAIIRHNEHHIYIRDVEALASKLSRPINLENWYF